MNKPKPIINDSHDVVICHGMEQHSLADEWKCEDCKKIKSEFEIAMQSGEIQKILDEVY